ncbi:flagellar basal body-associated FliL family protein [Pseudobdellovibrio exovorus]|uniref:Flagellar protein FliL n=1 Tax=Pseudobdellovibrio exovorus JSS TaxID=1184267 RepID=M4V6W1_9BACT|nr:flagellar basal body-associated FliL family protein [Pseudobdellovibrio exovorus]AGH94938.1 flagellar protein required for flagellar formation [Pseudobdellovibrio exovorus JSS]
MTDKRTKNQDVGPDQDPSLDTEQNIELNEEELLSDVDNILSEEDPEFLATISDITVSGSGLEAGIIGQALGMGPKKSSKFVQYLSYPFDFKSNLKGVLFFWLSMLLLAGAIYFVWSYSGGLLDRKLFVHSLAELGEDVRDYNPNSETEVFYDNPRFAKNLVTISSMHVNLRPSENSGSNPMLVLEITIEGASTDSIIEIKDREAELKDMLLRLTEAKTYDELAEAEGKQLLCDQYRDALNSVLTTGQVRRVLLKNFIIKS